MTQSKSWMIAAFSCSSVLVAGDPHPADLAYEVAYSTYLGGEGWDQAREIILNPDGSVLVGAQTCSTAMPVTEGALQPKYAGDDPALGHSGVYGGDCYLARISPDGRKVLAATYLGGSQQERNVYGMELDREGNVVIATATRSEDAPATEGCFQRKYGGGPSDMLVAKISPDLKRLLWCTFVGGSGDDSPRGGIALDREDNVCVVGTTTSEDFPATPGAFQRSRKGPRDSCAVKLKADGSGIIFATFLGGSGEDDAIMGVRLGLQDNLYVAGHTRSADFPVTGGAVRGRLGGGSDAYLAEISADGGHLVYATYLGGKLDEFAEHRPWLPLERSMLLAGFTASPDFPVTPDAFQTSLSGKGDGFLTKLAPDGKKLFFSTLLGGSGSENLLMPTVDDAGNVLVVGSTGSLDFPVTPAALRKQPGGGEDGALAVFDPEGARLLYSSYLGGRGDEVIRSIVLGASGDCYLVGSTSSDDFPVSPGALQKAHAGKGDSFIVKLVPKPFAPEEWISLFDGKTLEGWTVHTDRDYAQLYGKVSASEGKIVLEAGAPMTGITWTKRFPRDGYEISLQASRIEGNDFFCGLTFPVGDAYLTFIVGGWGGGTVGLSNIDGYSAVENETTTYTNFEKGQWYRIRLEVTAKRIVGWIDDARKFSVERKGQRFAIWPQQEPSRPLGITTYYTKAALRELKFKSLGEAE